MESDLTLVNLVDAPNTRHRPLPAPIVAPRGGRCYEERRRRGRLNSWFAKSGRPGLVRTRARSVFTESSIDGLTGSSPPFNFFLPVNLARVNHGDCKQQHSIAADVDHLDADGLAEHFAGEHLAGLGSEGLAFFLGRQVPQGRFALGVRASR
jgi:hypothetical protein